MSPEPPGAPAPQALQPGSLRSPPDSEAYYGETDSDVDGPATQEKPRRTRRRGPTRPALPGAPPDEVYLSDSPAEPAPAKTGSLSQGDSRVSSPSWEEGAALQPPPAEALLLPHGPLRPGPHLIPMVGPVPHPVGEDLTTTYTQKAKQASECLNPFVLNQDLSPNLCLHIHTSYLPHVPWKQSWGQVEKSHEGEEIGFYSGSLVTLVITIILYGSMARFKRRTDNREVWGGERMEGGERRFQGEST